MPDLWGILTIAVKWALYLGVLGAAGTVFCAVLIGLRQFRALAVSYAFIALASAVLSFMLKGAALTGDATGMTDPEMLSLLWQTKSGLSLKMQIGGLVLLLSGLVFTRYGSGIAAIGGLIAMGGFVTIGHIPDRAGWVLEAVLLMHLVCGAFWFGILVPLRRLAADPAHLSKAAVVGGKFGRIALLAVPVLVLAGGLMTYNLLGSPSAVIGSLYGQTLLLKVAAVALLLGLGAINKLRFVPAMACGETRSAAHLVRSITFEWIGFAVALAVTATLTSSLSLPV